MSGLWYTVKLGYKIYIASLYFHQQIMMWTEYSTKPFQDNFKPDRFKLADFNSKETFKQNCKKEFITTPLQLYWNTNVCFVFADVWFLTCNILMVFFKEFITTPLTLFWFSVKYFDECVWFKMVSFLFYDHLICLHCNLLLC